jgi:hypothetical protein
MDARKRNLSSRIDCSNAFAELQWLRESSPYHFGSREPEGISMHLALAG